jgi:hypothetical protein
MSDETTTKLWGIWGGMVPGGWCSFKVAAGGDGIGYGYAGTKEEAEAGKLVFESERHQGCTYDVVPFDHAREPAHRDARTTPAQWRMLANIRGYGTINGAGLGNNYRATLAFLARNGWYMHVVDEVGREQPRWPMKLTAAGERAWQKGYGRGGR